MRRLLPLAVLLLLAMPAAAPAAPVVGGAETEQRWPWMVYLEQGRNEIELLPGNYCGGSLIAPTWVMTAAHCIGHELVDPLITTVVIGRHSQSDDEGERIQARRIVVHEEYAGNGTPDVALVELEQPPSTPVPIQIAGPGEESLYAPGVAATILGWGNTSEGGSSSDVLMEAQVPIVTDEACGKAYAAPSWGWTPDHMICAGYPEGGVDTCQGDSGGPLIVPAPGGSWRQVGITSFGEGCAQPGYPGVYTEAAGAEVREWIRGHVPGAIAAASTPDPVPAPAPPPAQPASSPPAQPAAPASAARRKPAAKTSRALRKCLKKARKSKRKQRACRKAEARRTKQRARR